MYRFSNSIPPRTKNVSHVLIYYYNLIYHYNSNTRITKDMWLWLSVRTKSIKGMTCNYYHYGIIMQVQYTVLWYLIMYNIINYLGDKFSIFFWVLYSWKECEMWISSLIFLVTLLVCLHIIYPTLIYAAYWYHSPLIHLIWLLSKRTSTIFPWCCHKLIKLMDVMNL